MDNIKLNVGGTIFETTKLTLSPSSFFEKALSETWKKDEILFVDRSPKIFEHVLCLMRDVNYEYPKKYLSELEFYGVKIKPQKLGISNEDIMKRLKQHDEKLKKLDVVEADTLYISKNARYIRECIEANGAPGACAFIKCKSRVASYGELYCKIHSSMVEKISVFGRREFETKYRESELAVSPLL